MKDTVAFLTGIEEYANVKLNVAGPARMAVNYALWLKKVGLPPTQIYVFLSIARSQYEKDALAKLDADIAALRADGVLIRGAARDELYVFSRTELQKVQCSRLFVYWIGHGAVTSNRERVFYCQDYSTDLPYKLMDWTKLLLCLRAKAQQQQFVLADVCGVYAPTVNSPDVETYTPRKGVQHDAFYATLEGEYAEAKALGGEFSERALEILQQLGGWQDAKKFYDEILKVSPKRPFVFSADTTHFSKDEVRVGGAAQLGYLAGRGLQMLQAANRPESDFRALYERTITRLGNSGLWQARTLLAMLHELSGLGVEVGESVPRPLVEFLHRCGEKFGLAEQVKDWCRVEQVLDTTVNTITETLAKEKKRLYLVIELEEDSGNGELMAIEPALYNHDFTYANGPTWKRFEVESHDGACGFLREVVKAAKSFAGDAPLEVQFLANPTMFDREIHAWELEPNKPLGRSAPTVVRWRERLRNPSEGLVAWRDRDDAVRAQGVLTVAALPKLSAGAIKRGELNAQLDNHKSLFLLETTVGARKKRSELSVELNLILEALDRGVSRLGWVHSKGADVGLVHRELTKWAGSCAGIDELPEKLHLGRTKKDTAALCMTLLWDNPNLLPERGKPVLSDTMRLRLPG